MTLLGEKQREGGLLRDKTLSSKEELEFCLKQLFQLSVQVMF